MKSYVIDANVLFSAIIGSRRIYVDIIKNFDLYSPDFTLKEIEKYEELLLNKTKLIKSDLNNFLINLFKGITILPSIIIGKAAKDKAIDLCKDVDEKDTPYVSLAIELNIPLITNDKKLYNGLRKKKFNKIILLEDILEKIDKTG